VVHGSNQDIWTGDNRIGRLVEEAKVVSPLEPVRQVKDILGEEDPLKAVVVAEEDRPLGLVMSFNLNRTLSQRFGLSLYWEQPVFKVMDSEPLIVEADLPVEAAASQAMARSKDKVYDSVIVTQKGAFHGIVSVYKMLDYLASSHEERALQLVDANRKLARGIQLRKQAEAALRTAMQEAEAANRAKSDFLARMSHEIRTPMNAILGMAEILEETELNQEQRDYLGTLASSGDLLLGIINDILDFSKIEAGKIQLESVPFDLQEMLEETARIMAYRAHEKGLELVSRLGPDTPLSVIGDPVRLRQILVNLLSNAVKFTKRGEVVVEVHPDPAEDRPSCYLFSVRDTGIGIPADKIEAVFDSFTQADSSTTREFGGTGLGLAICKRLAELMDGRIWAESRVGQGTTFFFSVRLEEGPERIRTLPAALAQLKGCRVLVVDDNTTNRLIFKEHLGRWGAVIIEAENGWQALARLAEANERREPFQLALLDYHMPGMDGVELVRRMHQEKLALPASLMMFSSSDTGEGRDEARGAGISHYFVKPVRQAELIDAVLSALGRIDPQGVPLEKESRISVGLLPKMSVLLAEDYQPNRKIVESFLKATPVRLECVENGRLAVDRFQAEDFDVVLMDMEMPVMGGLEATRLIRAWEKETGRPPAPIIALTAHAFAEHKAMCLNAGCSDFIHKPVKKRRLIEGLIAAALTGREEPAEGTPAGDPPAFRPPKPEPKPETHYHVQVDPDLSELIHEYLRTLRLDCRNLVQAYKKRDYEALYGIGHDLKGSGAGYGLNRVTEIGQDICVLVKEKKHDALADSLKSLIDYVKNVRVSLPEGKETDG
jgi:signal transduction histidine kinase/DNA-binding response OmpR family regulator